MMYRDRTLLDLAERQRCLLQVPGVCCGDEATVVACHSNQGAHGKGKGIKAHDCYTVWGCHSCHVWLDQGPAPQDAKEQAFSDALDRQIIEWRDIAMNPAARPRNIVAARRALQALLKFMEAPHDARLKD